MRIAFKSITLLKKILKEKKEIFTEKMHQYPLLTVTSSFSAFMIVDILPRHNGVGY